MIPKGYLEDTPASEGTSAEEIIFDKADSAAEKESLKQEQVDLKNRMAEIADLLKDKTRQDIRNLEAERATAEKRLDDIESLLGTLNGEKPEDK